MEGLLKKMKILEEHHEIIKSKCMEYEDEFVTYNRNIDSLEQYSRRNCLLLHGIPESADEKETDTVFKDTITEHLGVTFEPYDLDRSHRLGQKKSKGSRPIIAKFTRYNKRHEVFTNKKKLKGTKIVVTESLTRPRVLMLEAAKKRYGKNNVWSSHGEILAKIGENVVNVATL